MRYDVCAVQVCEHVTRQTLTTHTQFSVFEFQVPDAKTSLHFYLDLVCSVTNSLRQSKTVYRVMMGYESQYAIKRGKYFLFLQFFFNFYSFIFFINATWTNV